MQGWKLLGKTLLGAGLLALVGCADEDLIIGTWKFNTGVKVTFVRGGTMEGVGEDGQKWTGTWSHEGDFVKLESGGFHSLAGKKTWRVIKVFRNELALKAANPETGEILTGTRDDTK